MKNIYATKQEMQREYDKQMNHYCPDCGEKMILKKEIAYYSPSSGQPLYQFLGKCPNARWWKVTHSTRIYNMPVVRKMKSGSL